MPDGKRMTAVVVGVADAPPLPYLRGAVNGAKAFYEWSSALGYEAHLITDEVEPVTLARLRVGFEMMLAPKGDAIHRLILYFAGHGLIREAEEGLWLLSDWNRELRAVAVEPLKRRLYRYGIAQISVIADACRSLPADLDAADLAPDPVIGRGPTSSATTPAIDKFVAAQDGTKAYMVPGKTPEEDRCIFSGVLLEGLWGMKPTAFSKVEKEKVTSRSLGAFLQLEVPQIARRYLTELNPSVSPTFPEGDDVYFSRGIQPPPSPPKLPPWPPPVPAGTLYDAPGADELEVSLPPGRPSAPSAHVVPDPVPDFRASGYAAFAIAPVRASVEQVWAQVSETRNIEAQPVFDLGWKGIRLDVQRQMEGLGPGTEVLPVLIEFDDGLYAAANALSGLSAVVRYENGRGVSSLVYQRVPVIGTLAERTIQQMENGALRADDATDLALNIREFKHIDPVLGVIGAYLYDSIGDVESIRRMAYFYIQHGQAIPYDIALLAQVPAQWRQGRFWLYVPGVPRRKPRTKAEQQVSWSYAATPPAEGVVGGLWPWMRQGWAFLEDATNDESTLIRPGLAGLVEHVKPGRFTTLDERGAKNLIDIVGLQPILPPSPEQAPTVAIGEN